MRFDYRQYNFFFFMSLYSVCALILMKLQNIADSI